MGNENQHRWATSILGYVAIFALGLTVVFWLKGYGGSLIAALVAIFAGINWGARSLPPMQPDEDDEDGSRRHW